MLLLQMLPEASKELYGAVQRLSFKI